ncbi:MAG: helix-turn-helix domain-containing protein [Desulfobaccales bacterium]
MTGADLKEWRRSRGISQLDLARLLGTYAVTVSRWETGARRVPLLLPLALEALEHRMMIGSKNGFTGGMPGVQEAE